MYATLIVSVLQVVGIYVDVNMITETILAVLQLAAFATWAYGQFARKDLSAGIVRKDIV